MWGVGGNPLIDPGRTVMGAVAAMGRGRDTSGPPIHNPVPMENRDYLALFDKRV